MPDASVPRSLPPAVVRALQHAPLLLSMLFLLLIGVELARLFWLLMPDGPAWEPPQPSAQAGAAAPREQLSIEPLLQAQLFGVYNPEPVTPVAVDPVDAPDTNLRLTLRGIVADNTPEGSRALIESSPNDLKPYSVGMSVPGNATLHAIHADRVLLKRNGRLETLRLEKDRPTDPGAVVAVTPPPRGGSTPTIVDAQAAQQLSEIRNTLLNDPTQASRYLRVQPARRGGQLVGYRIYPGRDRQIFRDVGLRPGDIVTRINGVNLDDPTRSLQLLGELSQAASIDLTVERAGNMQNFSVSLN